MKNWVLILGASSGIGAKCAMELAKNGMNIFGIYLRKPKDHIKKLTDLISFVNLFTSSISSEAKRFNVSTILFS